MGYKAVSICVAEGRGRSANQLVYLGLLFKFEWDYRGKPSLSFAVAISEKLFDLITAFQTPYLWV